LPLKGKGNLLLVNDIIFIHHTLFSMISGSLKVESFLDTVGVQDIVRETLKILP
jgi:hypothetical protein